MRSWNAIHLDVTHDCIEQINFFFILYYIIFENHENFSIAVFLEVLAALTLQMTQKFPIKGDTNTYRRRSLSEFCAKML